MCLTKGCTEICSRLYFIGSPHSSPNELEKKKNNNKNKQKNPTKNCELLEQILSTDFQKTLQMSVKDSTKFTRLHIPVRSKLVCFQVHITLLLSSLPPSHCSIKPFLSEGLRNTQLILAGLNTRFIVKIVLFSVCKEENNRALTRYLRFFFFLL